MLHDPKWNHGTLDGLITWLEGKDPAATYRFSDPYNCLIVQYMGGAFRQDWPEQMRLIYGGRDEFKVARGFDENPSPDRPYGHALARAYAARQRLSTMFAA